jgi:molybdenum cofactor cytidylyltransferase
MGDSIAAAVAAAQKSSPEASGWLVLPGDLPLIQSSTLLAVARALSRADVVVPYYRGLRGHPVGFSTCCGSELRELDGDQGASTVVRTHKYFELLIDDVGSVTDIDTVDDLRAAECLL